jgi:hypothetical protein
MRSTILKGLIIGCAFIECALVPLQAIGSSAPPRLLHHLNAGTRLVAKQPIIIPANADQITLSSGSMPGSICRLRVKEPKPFDRVLPEADALTVSGTARAGFTSSRRLALSTYVRFDSRAIDDLVCVADRGSHEMTFDEFERILAGGFSVKLPDQPPTVID